MKKSVEIRLVVCALAVGVAVTGVVSVAGRGVQAADAAKTSASAVSSTVSAKPVENLKLVTDMKPYAANCYGKTSYSIMVGDRSFSNDQNAVTYTTKPIEIYACAEDVPQTVWVKDYGNLNPLQVKWQVKIDGKLYKANYTFQDNTVALENLKSKCGKYLKLLQNQYHLQDLSLDTYESYYYSIFKFRSTASYDNSVKDTGTELLDEESLTEAALSWGVGMYTDQKIVLSWVEQQNKLLKAGKVKKIDLEPVMHILANANDDMFKKNVVGQK